MKKLVLLVLATLILTVGTSYAGEGKSVGKGNWLVGAATDVNHIWGGGFEGRTTFTLNTEVGYFLYNFLMPEAKFDFSITEGFNSEIFTAGARFYYNKGNALLPYARLNLGVGSIKAGDRATAFALNPGIGLDYLLTKNVAIGIQANYTAYIRSKVAHEIDFPISFSIYF